MWPPWATSTLIYLMLRLAVFCHQYHSTLPCDCNSFEGSRVLGTQIEKQYINWDGDGFSEIKWIVVVLEGSVGFYAAEDKLRLMSEQRPAAFHQLPDTKMKTGPEAASLRAKSEKTPIMLWDTNGIFTPSAEHCDMWPQVFCWWSLSSSSSHPVLSVCFQTTKPQMWKSNISCRSAVTTQTIPLKHEPRFVDNLYIYMHVKTSVLFQLRQ